MRTYFLKKHYLIFICLIGVFSCIPIKKEIYLQSGNDTAALIKNAPTNKWELHDSTYLLQPGDILSVKSSSITPQEYNFFSKNENEIKESDPILAGYKIDEEGFIELPVLGRLNIAGLSVIQTQKKIRTLAAKYLQNPTVNVRLISFQVTLLGEVNAPGKYSTIMPKTSIMDAIGMSKGLTNFADRSNIKLIRHVNNTAHVVYLNLLDEELISSPYYYLKPNDLILIAPLKAKNFKNFQAGNISLIISALTLISILILNTR